MNEGGEHILKICFKFSGKSGLYFNMTDLCIPLSSKYLYITW